MWGRSQIGRPVQWRVLEGASLFVGYQLSLSAAAECGTGIETQIKVSAFNDVYKQLF